MAHDPTIEKGTRDYKQWGKTEEQMLVTCMRELVDGQHIEKGNFKMSALKTLERMMHSRVENCQLLAVPHIKSKVRYMKDKFAALVELKNASGFGWDDAKGCVVADESIFSGWVKSHPKASGLNNKPLPYWDDLCVIFGSEMATGADAVQPADAASKVHTRTYLSDFMDTSTEQVDSYTVPADMGQNSVMEDLINQGIDMHATRLKEVEAEITSARAGPKGKEAGNSSAGSKRSRKMFNDDERAAIAMSMAATSENIARIATNYCLEGNLAVRRQYLYDELTNFGRLTTTQVTKVMRHLYRDDGDASTYFNLRTEEEKMEFVLSLLE